MATLPATRAVITVAVGLTLLTTAACTRNAPIESSGFTGAASTAAPAGTDSASTAAGPLLSPAAALAVLMTMPVLARQPYVAGYQRSCDVGDRCSFGKARAGDPAAACNTRQLILQTTLSDVVMRPGSRCTVERGRLADPYTGTEVPYSADNPDAIEVDHAVPLLTAWALGAAHWTQAQRVTFANDRAIELVAVDRASNQAKSDKTPAVWMPPARFAWCEYDARWVTVLHTYRLPVLAADKTAITAVLRTCSSRAGRTDR